MVLQYEGCEIILGRDWFKACKPIELNCDDMTITVKWLGPTLKLIANKSQVASRVIFLKDIEGNYILSVQKTTLEENSEMNGLLSEIGNAFKVSEGLKKVFYWLGMKLHVENFVKTCDVCLKNKLHFVLLKSSPQALPVYDPRLNGYILPNSTTHSYMVTNQGVLKDIVQQSKVMMCSLKENLISIHTMMAIYADKPRSKKHFEVGDQSPPVQKNTHSLPFYLSLDSAQEVEAVAGGENRATDVSPLVYTLVKSWLAVEALKENDVVLFYKLMFRGEKVSRVSHFKRKAEHDLQLSLN
ncbi:hypothetical protein C2S52_000824 [Perilla frutescens var. hirtella]|nr:hypothetical protein C2S52_000824 [Perilla frutescens var. hirtella]